MKQILTITFSFFLSIFSFSQEYGWVDLSDNLPDNAFPITDIFFLNENEGWVTASSVSEIYHTTDGGLTFETQTTLQPSQTIYMLNELEGFAGGQSGAVHHTSDGGETWNLINNFLPGTIFSMSFPPDSDTGYICGNDGWVGKINSNEIFDMEKLVYSHLYAISFPTKGEGWLCGGSIIQHYTNNQWVADQNYPFEGYNAMYMLNPTQGWVAGDGGVIIYTSDGNNWTKQKDKPPTINDIYFINETHGWAVAWNYINYTTDGGSNWNIDSISSLDKVHFVNVFFLNESLGFVSGYKQDEAHNSSPAFFKYMEISGVEEWQQNALSFVVFPNPAKDKFKVQSLMFEVGRATVEIYDLNGKKLIEKQIPKGTEIIEIDVSSLENGVYFCRIWSKEYSVTKKLIIQP